MLFPGHPDDQGAYRSETRWPFRHCVVVNLPVFLWNFFWPGIEVS
jgi:hypothetical protein